MNVLGKFYSQYQEFLQLLVIELHQYKYFL